MEEIIEIDENGKVHGNDLKHALASALNRFSAENPSNTPDWILAQYLLGCLAAWNQGVQQRETWHGRDARPSVARSGPAPISPLGHGTLCEKKPHVGEGYYRHGADDDSAYSVDHVYYCGRCHRAL